MCGIAGVARHGRDSPPLSAESLERMARALHHRGPDDWGVHQRRTVGLVHTRLAIIDVANGHQPLTNEDGTIVVSFNGEIYNYVELREELAARGHRFRTASDTEVLVHGYEEWGTGLLDRLNGQFAFAIDDARTDRVWLVRDRFGVRPLFYALSHGDLYFASEIKALFASGGVEAAPDWHGLDETFSLWAARAPRTTFRGVLQLEPGSHAWWQRGRLQITRWYTPRYDEARDEPARAIEQLDEVMRSAVRLRLRADVPVGGYLSGGLDSTITCALAAAGTAQRLRTFSVTFADPRFDESAFQRLVAEAVQSVHHVTHIGATEIASVFPEVVWHAETPLLRTAPAPMYLLARSVREAGVKVVLTGEGADELFLGYDLFKETSVRLFCLRHPESVMRPRLLDRLYPYLAQGAGGFWRRFFLDAGAPDDPLFSHQPRHRLASRIKEFYSPDMHAAVAGVDHGAELRATLPADFDRWSPLNRAAWLELTLLLPSYLLSSQGDRMAMAHGVEGRFPFLDHRLFELAAALPTSSKLLGLREKEILKRWARPIVPRAILERHKQPYRAPDNTAFFAGGKTAEYVRELLSPAAIRDTGVFDSRSVDGLVRRCEAGRVTGAAENQALVAILSTQLWSRAFLSSAASPSCAGPGPFSFTHHNIP